MKDFKLPHAIVIASVLVVFGLLAWQEIDTGIVIAGLLAVLGGIGWNIKQGAEQNEQNKAIQTAVNGNNHSLVETIKNQHAEAQAAQARQMEVILLLVKDNQEAMRAMVTDTNTHFRALAERLGDMVPVAAVSSMAPTSAPPNGGSLDSAYIGSDLAGSSGSRAGGQ